MPNSILWVGLVVLWVFVLFPMLADRHPRIRRTTDAALATRVLHRGDTKRRMKKGPAAGHESDPDWVPTRVHRKLSHGDDAEDRMTTSADETVTEHDDETARDRDPAEPTADTDSEILEAEIDDEMDDGAIDDAATDDAPPAGAAEVDDAEADTFADAADADFSDEYDEESTAEPTPAMARIPPVPSAADPALLPEAAEFDSDDPDFVPTRRGRGGYDPESDAMARRMRYRFRQRTALGLALSALMFGGFAFAVAPMLWWGCALAVLILGTYLAYLRRQVRMEEEIRRRRAARLSRSRQQPNRAAPDSRQVRDDRAALDRDAARVLRRRAVVLDVDDEDAAFDHLEPFDAAAARATRNRAAGGEIRRAAGE
ncbi:gephyrin-like molybdotransferase receptor GlpR [Nocardia wallacei]|uniref:Membrane protein n=1 Tax=Nocardia wallacei TaxID=480035 RepID=A0A7G1KTI0_9NOCA|nr:gephyrin-like molybdotransferase receptor GlpR [Nocardia wallacei]BCK58558.1 membrane protein [Nocardia wallacei]